MARTVIVDLATGRILFVKTGEPATDLTAYLNSYGAAGRTAYNLPANLVPDNLNELLGKKFIGGVISDYENTLAQANAERTEQWQRRLAVAFGAYQDGVTAGGRRGWWPSLRSGANADRPLVATDRWAYHQIALGRQVSDRTAFATLTEVQRGTVIHHIVSVIGTLGEVWYDVMVSQEAQAGGGNSARWAIAAMTDLSVIYSDIVTTTGATRAPDGSFTALPVVIPAGFKPDTPTLR